MTITAPERTEFTQFGTTPSQSLQSAEKTGGQPDKKDTETLLRERLDHYDDPLKLAKITLEIIQALHDQYESEVKFYTEPQVERTTSNISRPPEHLMKSRGTHGQIGELYSSAALSIVGYLNTMDEQHHSPKEPLYRELEGLLDALKKQYDDHYKFYREKEDELERWESTEDTAESAPRSSQRFSQALSRAASWVVSL